VAVSRGHRGMVQQLSSEAGLQERELISVIHFHIQISFRFSDARVHDFLRRGTKSLRKQSQPDGNARTFLVVFLVAAIFGLSYLWSPGARNAQGRMERELKALPLPPDTTDVEFTSGYQPSKGRASRVVISGRSPGELCHFFSALMINAGWQQVQETCYAGEVGHTLVSFNKGSVFCRVQYLDQDIFGKTKYAIVSTWPR
jgi:hypothetical protein